MILSSWVVFLKWLCSKLYTFSMSWGVALSSCSSWRARWRGVLQRSNNNDRIHGSFTEVFTSIGHPRVKCSPYKTELHCYYKCCYLSKATIIIPLLIRALVKKSLQLISIFVLDSLWVHHILLRSVKIKIVVQKFEINWKIIVKNVNNFTKSRNYHKEAISAARLWGQFYLQMTVENSGRFRSGG